MNPRNLPLAAVAAAALAVAGCGSSNNSNSAGNGSTSATTSPTATNAQASGGKLGPRDRDYVIKTQQGALFEIQAGKLALKNAQSAPAKAFAKRMIKDHGAEAQALSKLAAPLGVKLPPKPDNTEVKEIQTISKYKGHRFDTAYLRLEIADHRDDIQGAHKEHVEGVNKQVVAFSGKATQLYRTHLNLATSAQSKVGGQG